MKKLNRWRRAGDRALRRSKHFRFPTSYTDSPLSSPAALALEPLESRRMLAVGDELVTIRLETTDLVGNAIEFIKVGEQFQLRAYVEDPNATPSSGGVFAAYFDTTYEAALASVSGAIAFGASYPNVQNGSTAVAGELDEVGATIGGAPLGEGEFLLFSVPFTANAAGTINFETNVAEELPFHRILISGGSPGGVAPEDVHYGTTSILVYEEPTISISDETNVEGAAVVFQITLSHPVPVPVTFDIETQDITAFAGSDYTQRVDSLTFVPGNTSLNFLVSLANDSINEPVETFRVQLSNATNATFADDEGIGTIEDDDDPPTVSIENVSVNEGNSGTSQALFTVSLSTASEQVITVDFSTGNQTATAGSDYTATIGTVTFLPGELVQTIAIDVQGDTLSEIDETFTVDLSNPVNVVIDVGQAIGTILDDDPIGILIDDAELVEGDAGTSNMSFTVRLTRASDVVITVTATASPLTAQEGADYQATTQQLTFQPGETEKTFLVPIVGDLTRESNETLAATLTSPTGGAILDGQAVGTIIDNDPVPSISISDASTYDNVVGTVNLDFIVTLSNPSDQTVTVDFATLQDSALAGSDFTAATGTVTFAPGVTQQVISIVILGDTDDEPDEQFFVDLTNPTNATIADDRGVGTLLEIPPQLSINDVSIVEGDAGTVDLVFTVTLSEEVNGTVSVDFTTVSDTALADVDFQTLSGTLTFAPNQLTQTITIKIIGDLSDEFNENFFVNLSNPVGATIGDGQGVGTIIDNDDIPLISVAPVSQAEGNSGITSFEFIVSLSEVSGKTVTVQFATSDQTATAGSDYTALTTTVTFQPGEQSQTVVVQVLGDTVFELDETFLVSLSNPVNAGLEDPADEAIGTIQNDETRPTISIEDASVVEGDSGLTEMTFLVRLSHASSETITVFYSTSDGTATAGSDYETSSGTLTFAPGVTELPVVVQIIGDTMDEPHETLLVTLDDPTNATLADGEAIGTITDDDGPTTISISSASIVEGNNGTTNLVFTLTLSRATEQTVTVQFSTADGTAQAGLDYLASAGTVTFNPLQTTQTLVVPIVGDLLDEDDETFSVVLSSPVNAEIEAGTATGTIVDDDDAPTIAIDSPSTTEGDTGTRQLAFKLTLSAASGRTITVNYATLASTAAVGIDFDAAGGTVTFAPGEVEKFINVAIIGDTFDEDDETFFVDLTNSVNAGIAVNRGTATIYDDDRTPTLAITNAFVTEGDSGTQTLSFVVILSEASGRTVTVQYATADNTATVADGDYQATSGILTFAPGETQKVVQVVVFGDEKEEPDETLFVNLSNPTNAVFDTLLLGSPQGTGVIISDDLPYVVGSLSGFAFVDSNSSGVRESYEKLLAGVRITLSGTDILGQTVTRTTYTSKTDGSYFFGNLVPGRYTIEQPDQPSNYDDGLEQPGSLGIVGDPQNDRFVVDLGSEQHGTEYNFGEKLKPVYYSRALYLASTPNPHPITEVSPLQPDSASQAALMVANQQRSSASAFDQAFAQIGTLGGSPSVELLRLIGVGMTKKLELEDNSLFDPFGDVDLG
ncbi:MAG: hypothetical protein KF708_24405 [Pirellulales bacterium]|nr:hypothetical protein [Pirellulales bacterium]